MLAAIGLIILGSFTLCWETSSLDGSILFIGDPKTICMFHEKLRFFYMPLQVF
jgi:hypothetical protein